MEVAAFEDICLPLFLFVPLVQRPTLVCDVILKKVHDNMALLLTSDTRYRDGFSPRTFVGLISYYLYSSLYSVPLIISSEHPRMVQSPQIGP